MPQCQSEVASKTIEENRTYRILSSTSTAFKGIYLTPPCMPPHFKRAIHIPKTDRYDKCPSSTCQIENTLEILYPKKIEFLVYVL